MNRSVKKNMTREQVVASMAKKLSQGSGKEIFSTQKKKGMKPHLYLYIIMSILIVSTAITGIIVTRNTANKLLNSAAPKLAAVFLSPLELITAAHREEKISTDQCALYLKDILVRYDSLPPEFKPNHAVIADTSVYKALVTLWPHVSLQTRSSITTRLPKLEEQLNAARHE